MFRPSCIGAILLSFLLSSLSWAMHEQLCESEEAYKYLLTELQVAEKEISNEINRVKDSNFYEVAAAQLLIWRNFVEKRKKKSRTTMWGFELGTQYTAVLGGIFGSCCSLGLGVAAECAHILFFGTTSQISPIPAAWLGGTAVGYAIGYLGQKAAEKIKPAKNEIFIMQQDLIKNMDNFCELSAHDQFSLLAIYSGLIRKN